MSRDFWVEMVANAAWEQDQGRELQPTERGILWAADEIDELNAEIRALKQDLERANNPWVSVEDELPEDGLFVLFATERDAVCYGFHDGEEWVCAGPLNPYGPVTHWAPIPAKGERE